MATWLNNTFTRAESTISLYSTAILSLIFATVLVFVATRKFTIASGAITIVMAIIFYILASSARGQNLEGSLPVVSFPIPPHLGLNGVSLQNLYPNRIGYGVQ